MKLGGIQQNTCSSERPKNTQLSIHLPLNLSSLAFYLVSLSTIIMCNFTFHLFSVITVILVCRSSTLQKCFGQILIRSTVNLSSETSNELKTVMRKKQIFVTLLGLKVGWFGEEMGNFRRKTVRNKTDRWKPTVIGETIRLIDVCSIARDVCNWNWNWKEIPWPITLWSNARSI